jgi:hypothetical protein
MGMPTFEQFRELALSDNHIDTVVESARPSRGSEKMSLDQMREQAVGQFGPMAQLESKSSTITDKAVQGARMNYYASRYLASLPDDEKGRSLANSFLIEARHAWDGSSKVPDTVFGNKWSGIIGQTVVRRALMDHFDKERLVFVEPRNRHEKGRAIERDVHEDTDLRMVLDGQVINVEVKMVGDTKAKSEFVRVGGNPEKGNPIPLYVFIHFKGDGTTLFDTQNGFLDKEKTLSMMVGKEVENVLYGQSESVS